jgi:hypothetical protein
MNDIHDYHEVRVIAFEAQGRDAEERSWITLRVTRRWSEIEDALARVAGTVDCVGRHITCTRVVTVDHSASVDARSAS